MNCKCGFSFLPNKNNGYESFALILNKDYQEFLNAEIEVLKCEDEESELIAIERSSHFVGSALLCPICQRLTLLKPGKAVKAYYTLEV